MISTDFFMSFLWGPRKESVDQCASRLVAYLADLAKIDSVFTSLYADPGVSTKCNMGSITEGELKALLLKGVNRRDIGRQVITELGFSVSFLAGPPGRTLPFQVHCGGYTNWVLNTCTMQFPAKGAVLKRLLKVPTLINIARTVIRNWQPDHGVITSAAVSPEPDHSTDFSIEAGWITYLSDEKYHHMTEIATPAEAFNVEGGQLIVATDSLFSVENEDHLASLRRIASLIRKR